ncbi:MAG: tetratricopeptide repeat protein [Desulfosalsimonas sp.]
MTENSPKTRGPEQGPETDDPLKKYMAGIQAFARTRKKQLIAAAAILCAAVIVAAGAFYFLERARGNASAMLIQTTRQYEQLGENPDEKAIEKVKQDFEKLIDKYGYTSPAKVALLPYAGICYRTGDYQRALELYENAYETFENSPEFSSLALNGMAHAHAAMGENSKALSFFEKLVEDQNPALKDQALFNLGLLYSLTGDSEKSRRAYEQLVSDFPDSMFAEPAKDNLSG